MSKSELIQKLASGVQANEKLSEPSVYKIAIRFCEPSQSTYPILNPSYKV
jgi:hypothetical protein